VFDAVCDDLQINSNTFYDMLNEFLQKAKLGNSIEELVISIKPDRIPPHKRILKQEGIKNMLYVLSEMRIIIEEYREL